MRADRARHSVSTGYFDCVRRIIIVERFAGLFCERERGTNPPMRVRRLRRFRDLIGHV